MLCINSRCAGLMVTGKLCNKLSRCEGKAPNHQRNHGKHHVPRHFEASDQKSEKQTWSPLPDAVSPSNGMLMVKAPAATSAEQQDTCCNCHKLRNKTKPLRFKFGKHCDFWCYQITIAALERSKPTWVPTADIEQRHV